MNLLVKSRVPLREEREVEDVVDSDFDIDEDDEPVSDQETDEKRKRKVGTKAYKDPNRKRKGDTEKKKPTAKKSKEKPPKEHSQQDRTEKSEKNDKSLIDTSIERKSIRQSTAVKSAETLQRIKIRSELKKKKPKKVEEKMPTQEELLEEALITEKENLKSLERFEQIELERKKIRPTKKTITGPVIKLIPDTQTVVNNGKFVSGLLTPADLDIPETKMEAPEKTEGDNKMDIDVIGPDEEINVEKITAKEEKPANTKYQSMKFFERTLLSFENDIHDKAFKACFPQSQPKRRRQLLCAVTKRPARYMDPVTKLPYRSVDAFRIIREAYYQQLEARGDKGDPQVAAWLQWRKADALSSYVQIHMK
ncbi:hypothetical protein K1T71_006789 [Dendrolimus kikuchii]|uniref:Uncharacterized protein n=1 Tax=Dendrolimus kikuchii TaxID=765133 RepID=A0ACC1D1U1_9NEOP|nr:hypothetical protein K1T71_006789 [Dendrolimus kikuchii]